MSTSKTAIEWTDRTWSPVRGCSRVSAGCQNCYAMGQAHRFSGAGQPYEGLTTIRRGKVDWTGNARFVPATLGAPLRWRKPQRIFVNSMSDLFHESLSNEEIAAVFGVMAACPQHTFQVLTKRPERASVWFAWYETITRANCAAPAALAVSHASQRLAKPSTEFMPDLVPTWPTWPLPNVWLGVSVENQETADERIPLLIQTPAAVRFVSYEPALGPVDFRVYLREHACDEWPKQRGAEACAGHPMPPLDWVIVGGESGPGARPFDISWAEQTIRQCREAGLPCFVKQLGGRVFAPWKVRWAEQLDGSFDAFSVDRVGVLGTNLATVWRNGVWHTWDAAGITGGENSTERTVEAAKTEAVKALQRQHINPVKGWSRHAHMLHHKKGADMREWPETLRVREFPQPAG